MKITFSNPSDISRHFSPASSGQSVGRSETPSRAYGDGKGVKVSIGEKEMGSPSMEAGMLAGMQEFIGFLDVGVRQDYMTVMANTMSAEDFARLDKDGFSIREMDPREAVTILDRIKAELAKAGKEIRGFNDDLDMEKLEAALGSSGLAREIKKSFAREDLPLGDSMAEEVRKAWEMARTLKEPADGEYQYMLREGLEPKIADFYLAENSGAGLGSRGGSKFYPEAVSGYYARSARGENSKIEDFEGPIGEQMDRVIRQSGLEPNEDTRARARWMVERDIPLDKDRFLQLCRLEEVEFPVTEERFAAAVSRAVAEGKSPLMADLSPAEGRRSVYEQANELLERFAGGEGEQLSDRRILEEIRLRMTAEVNVRLIRSGFAIDTAPMEEIVEALRAAEKEVAGDYFPEDARAVEKYELFERTNRIVGEIPALPAAILGPVAMAEPKMTVLSGMHQAGRELMRAMKAAKENYEALMTAPRADLGDSISKAFVNIDEILRDLDLEPVESNRKAVRILAYNHMEMTSENVEKVSRAKDRVENIVSKMTPASVLKMIRDGINPLETGFDELEDYLGELPEDFRTRAENYAKFLYRCEQKGELTDQERSGYIGIYRLLHQMEKRDGAAVGALVDLGAELNFANLLTAVRSSRKLSMDIRLEEREYLTFERGESGIDDQIRRAFANRELEEWRAAGDCTEVMEWLENIEAETTIQNILYGARLREEKTTLYRHLPPKAARLLEGEKLLEVMEDRDAFSAEYLRQMEEVGSELEKETLDAENSDQLQDLRMRAGQIRLLGAAGHREEYFLPMELEEGMTAVHLTFEHDEHRKGTVSIGTKHGGNTRKAVFRLQAGRLSATLFGNGREEVMELGRLADIFTEYLKDEFPISMDAEPEIVDTAGNSRRAEKAPVGGKKTVQSTDREEANAAAPERGELYGLAKLWIRVLTQKEVSHENKL